MTNNSELHAHSNSVKNLVDDIRLVGRENARVLLVDDNEDLLKLISIRLRPFKFILGTATSAEEALTLLQTWAADLVITDLQLPGLSGMDLFQHIQRENPLLPVIFLTAHGTIQDAVEATQSGAASYLTKPFDSEVLIEHIQRALFTSGFNEAQTISSDALLYDRSWRSEIITANPAMKALLAQIERIAETNILVLLQGESGVGKGLLAHAVHRRSNRGEKPLIEVNCAFFTDELLDAEVFGVTADGEKGIKARKGKLELANGGTLLLRDIDEAPVRFLRKLMHALIDGEASTINSINTYKLNVRPIVTSSTTAPADKPNQELWDLGDKLGITTLEIPPLRARREDIPLIINHHINELQGDREIQFAPDAMRLLSEADWPGNIQHLINVIRQCIRLSGTKIIPEALVSSRIKSPLYKIAPLSHAQREFERKYVLDVLKATRGNVTKAANIAKRNRTEFHRLLKKHQIDAKPFRRG